MYPPAKRLPPTNRGPSLSGAHLCLTRPVLSIRSDVLPEGDVAIACSNDFIDGGESIVDIMGRYHQKLVPLVDAFEGFHDLEDDDGDEDEEDYRLSWDRASSDDEVDEPDGR